MNGEYKDILKVEPEVGKAVLFYNQLRKLQKCLSTTTLETWRYSSLRIQTSADGNYDERSQHAALPVIEGEKWLSKSMLLPIE